MITQQKLELEGFVLMTSYCLYVSTVSLIPVLFCPLRPPDHKNQRRIKYANASICLPNTSRLVAPDCYVLETSSAGWEARGSVQL